MKYDDGKSRAGERGAINIKVALVLLAASALVFLIIKIAPVYIEEREIKYEVDELARVSAVRGYTEDRIKTDLQKIRTNYGLPDDSLKVTTDNRNVKITIGYTRSVDLLVTTYDWKVEYTSTGKEL
jgi:uncharacterized membrane protein